MSDRSVRLVETDLPRLAENLSQFLRESGRRRADFVVVGDGQESFADYTLRQLRAVYEAGKRGD